MSNKSERKRYVSKGGYIMGSYRAEGVEVWLHPEQAEPYMPELLSDAPASDAKDPGASATPIAAPAEARKRVSGAVQRLRQ